MGKVVNQNDLNAVIDSASKILDPIKSVVDSIGAIIKNAPKVSDKQIQSATYNGMEKKYETFDRSRYSSDCG